MIEKRIPDDKIIELLTKEIKEFGLEFARTKPRSDVNLSVFNMLKDKIPKYDIKPAMFGRGTYDMERKDSDNIKQVIEHMNASYCTNTLYYSYGSSLNWHTNSDVPGMRTYILYTTKPGIFRYKDPETGEIVDDEDYVGWTQRTFKVDQEKLLWHCVYSPAPRFAYGFNHAFGV